MNGQNGGMFGQSNAAGGSGPMGGAGPMGSDFGANMFGGRGGLPKGGMCPMLQSVTDMQAFKMSCISLMQVIFQRQSILGDNFMISRSFVQLLFKL